MVDKFHILASFVTILTALINVFYAIGIQKFHIQLPTIDIKIPNYYIKIVIFFYLEFIICLFFGYMKLRIIQLSRSRNSRFWFVFLLPIIVSVLLSSAWTTFFNINWIFVELNSIQSFASIEFFKFLAWIIVSVVLMGFVGVYICDIARALSFRYKILALNKDSLFIELSAELDIVKVFITIHLIVLSCVGLYQFFHLVNFIYLGGGLGIIVVCIIGRFLFLNFKVEVLKFFEVLLWGAVCLLFLYALISK